MKTALIINILISIVGLVFGCFGLSLNTLEPISLVFLFLLGTILITRFVSCRIRSKKNQWALLFFGVFSIASFGLHFAIPEYLYGFRFNGIMHRSLVTSLCLITAALAGICYSLQYTYKWTPQGYDISRYPLLLLPVLLAFSAYAIILYHVIVQGAPPINWKILTTPFAFQQWKEMVWKDGWPIWIPHTIEQVGMRNHILGTFVLMGLTTIISLPIGVAVGIYSSEYSTGWFGKAIRFSTQILRAISVFVIAMVAYNLIRYSAGSFLSDVICGYYYDPLGSKHIAKGSFLIASVFLSLLVIPMIAKATEEGVRSLPQDIKDGSLAVGASKDYSLFHLILPWSMPNIITALVLGCAEAAGGLSIIMFMAGSGEYGISPFNEVTSLAYLIFDIHYGKAFGSQIPKFMGSYQFTAAFLLLMITMGLTVISLLFKRHFSKRYKTI
jgi:phosphate transport system permease protein